MSLLPVPAVRQQKPGPPSILGTPTEGNVGYGTTDILITPPVGIPNGAKLCVGLCLRGGENQLGTVPAGWTQKIYTPKSGSMHVWTYEGVHDGSANYTVTRAAYSQPWNWCCTAFSSTGSIGATASDEGWGNYTAIESVTPTNDAKILAHVFVHDGRPISSVFTGFTEILDNDMYPSVYEQTAIQSGGVATGAQTSSVSHENSLHWVTQTLALEAP